jgi:hypothetical protein
MGTVQAIISDGNLELGASGQDLLKWASEKLPRRPLIYLMTGDILASESSEENEALKGNSLERVFFKPFDPFDLASTVNEEVKSLTRNFKSI